MIRRQKQALAVSDNAGLISEVCFLCEKGARKDDGDLRQVNSRDELALSQAINIPYRELAHKQFTALRKVAREKNMPMFQV